jgi:hypothetical protein
MITREESVGIAHTIQSANFAAGRIKVGFLLLFQINVVSLLSKKFFYI